MKADGIFHRAQLLGLVCIACSLWGAERCQAHPASHVDAWARIGTHLEIRVTVFLDSVLEVRSDAEQSDVEPTLVSAEAARQALLRFDETLQQQLTIWDETGRQLLPRIQRRPRWTPPDRGVDLQAVSSLRLTWQLRYPWRPSQQSFSVSHSFVKHQQPGLEAAIPERTPCELRLRVRSDVSGRRIDTIITDHLRHTIVLPQSTSHNVTPSVSSVPAARLVVLPTQLIHEFTIPESQVPAAFTLFESAADTLSVKDNARLRRQVEPWVRQNCQVTADGIELSPTAITTELLTAQDERFSNGAFSDASSASGEIRVGIRTVHPLRISPDRISVTWKSMTQSIADVQLDTLRGHISTSQLIDRNDSAPDELTYSWDVPSHHRTDEHTVDAVTVFPEAADGLWQPSSRAPRFGRLVWFGLAAAFGIVAAGLRRKRPRQLFIALSGLMIGVVLVAAVSGPSAEPDPRVAAAMLTRMLDRVYRAVRIPHDRTAVEQLSDVLSDDLVEQVFEQNASAMSPSADDAPFVRISNVSVNQCATTTFEAMSEARFYCEWQVDGQVLHWGHRHERKMVLSGTIRMEVAEDGCRITGITMQSVKTLAKPTGT